MTVGATQGVKAWWAISLVACLAALRDDAMNTATVAVHDITDEHTKTQDTSREGETISALIGVLSSEDGLKRQAAREALVRIRAPAAAPLIEKLAALEDIQPVLAGPIAAQTALTGLDPFVYSLTIKDVCRGEI